MNDRYRSDIADRFIREARTFANELIEGTNNYQQLYSLSEQFPHDYHDRFLVELVQNANDASTGGEVRIVLDELSEGVPRLYVANQGKPFTRDNFEALCSLGLSDKDPNKAIGNKGLGFRSVLQVCLDPHIYSTADDPDRSDSGGFDGYCFELTPSARDVVTRLINETLVKGRDSVNVSQVMKERFEAEVPLLSEPSRVERLCSRIRDDGCVVSGEVQYLSPYSFPLPLTHQSPQLDTLCEEGFVTVIELALTRSEHLMAARRAIGSIVSEYLLFTPRLKKLSVQHITHSDEDNLSMVLEKTPIGRDHRFYPPAPLTGVEIVRRQDNAFLGNVPDNEEIEDRMWWIHAGDVAGEQLKLALQELPAKWHGVTKATVHVALERTLQEPQTGRFSIYLPTEKETGSPVSVNGPFYGNLARTDINFSKTYNNLLLEKAAALLVEMLNHIREAGHLEDGTAVLDILDCRTPQSDLVQLLDRTLEESGTPLSDIPVVYREPHADGTNSRNPLAVIPGIRVLPESRQPRQFLTPSRLTQVGGCFPASIITENRRMVLERLAHRVGSSLTPEAVEIADWVQKLASSLIKRGGTDLNDWNAFYREISDLNETLPFQDVLRTCRVLLTEDQRLVAADGDGPRIFAFPVRTSAVTEDTDDERQPDSSKPTVVIPSAIKARVAFLHSGISLYEDRPPRMFNSVGRFLRQGSPPMVRDYETRAIVNDAIVPLVRKASGRNNASSRRILAQALRWAYQLYLNAPADAAFAEVQWNRLYVPTVSEWRPATETYFGTGWTGTSGCLVESAFPPGHPALHRLLVAPEELARLVVEESLDLSSDELRGWVTFLRDRCNVLETPMVRETVFQKDKPDEGQEHLHMSGYKGTYATAELGNHFGLPDSIWSPYLVYLRDCLTAPYKGWHYYHLERLATLEGLMEVNTDTASAYAQLVARGFTKLQDSLQTSVTRRDSSITPYSARADSSLAFALKHLSWLPYISGDEREVKGLSDPDHVWFIPPDILDSPLSRMRYSFVNHLPKDVAVSMTDEFRQFLGLRAVRISSAGEGLMLLGDLALSWRAGLSPERRQFFMDLWRDTLVRTAVLWRDLPSSERETLSQKSQDRGLSGLLVTPAGRRFPEWRNLATEDEPVSPVYLPDEPGLKSSMAEWVDIAEMRGEQIASQVGLLKELFGSSIACISELEFMPVSSSIPDVQHALDSAASLTSQFPWLEAFALTVYAFGRSQEMSVTGDDFRRVARRLRRLKYLEVPGLQLRLEGLDTTRPPLCPPCYYWDRHRALLVNPEIASSSEDLVAGLRALFDVQDIEPPLRLALSKLTHVLDDIDPPEHELQVRSLRLLHVSAEQFALVRRVVASGDDEWISMRLAPAICALNGIADASEASNIRQDFLELTAASSVKEALQRFQLGGVPLERPVELYELAADATGDQDMAYRLWTKRGLSLATWNDSTRALGQPYRVCYNDDVEDEFRVIIQQLNPVVTAIVREALKKSGAVERYVSLKNSYSGLVPQDDLKERFWRLPLEVVTQAVRCWFESQLPDTTGDLLDLLSVSVGDVQELESMAIKHELDLTHDDDLVEQQNRLALERLVESCLTHILAAWIASGHAQSQIPGPVSRASESGKLLSQDHVRSMSQFGSMSEAEHMNLVIEHFTELGVFAQLGIESKAWDSLVSLTNDLSATSEQLEQASARLKGVREYNERRARMRRILGTEYEMPRGDLYEGLKGIMDAQLGEDLLTGVDLFRTPYLGEAPKPAVSGRRGRGPGKGRRVSSRDRDLIGAVGEYVVYKVLCRQIGASAAGQAWKSGNRRHFLVDDTGDDTLGYDFELPRHGKLLQVEVKSSQGDPQFIDLTDTEVEAARAAARRRSHKDYVVCFVQNTLTQPKMHQLGNPFAPTDKVHFRVEEGGARVHFRLSQREAESADTEAQPKTS